MCLCVYIIIIFGRLSSFKMKIVIWHETHVRFVHRTVPSNTNSLALPFSFYLVFPHTKKAQNYFSTQTHRHESIWKLFRSGALFDMKLCFEAVIFSRSMRLCLEMWKELKSKNWQAQPEWEHTGYVYFHNLIYFKYMHTHTYKPYHYLHQLNGWMPQKHIFQSGGAIKWKRELQRFSAPDRLKLTKKAETSANTYTKQQFYPQNNVSSHTTLRSSFAILRSEFLAFFMCFSVHTQFYCIIRILWLAEKRKSA